MNWGILIDNSSSPTATTTTAAASTADDIGQFETYQSYMVMATISVKTVATNIIEFI